MPCRTHECWQSCARTMILRDHELFVVEAPQDIRDVIHRFDPASIPFTLVPEPTPDRTSALHKTLFSFRPCQRSILCDCRSPECLAAGGEGSGSPSGSMDRCRAGKGFSSTCAPDAGRHSPGIPLSSGSCYRHACRKELRRRTRSW